MSFFAKIMPRFRPSLLLVMAAISLSLVVMSHGAAITITNPGFESNVLSNPPTGSTSDNFIVAVGEGQTLTAVPGWTFSATQSSVNSYISYGGVSDLAAGNHAPEGALDNNIAWLFINGGRPVGSGTVSAVQTLSATLLTDTRYTLTLRVAQSAHAEGNPSLPNPAFPTLGDGVSTGDVFARLRAGGAAMPGFRSGASSVSVPADNAWVAWTLVWETGAAEALAGQALSIELFNRGTTAPGSLPIEVFFDDVALDASPVPEPSALALIAAGAAWMLRRRRV